jgi:hypothetical protein
LAAATLQKSGAADDATDGALFYRFRNIEEGQKAVATLFEIAYCDKGTATAEQRRLLGASLTFDPIVRNAVDTPRWYRRLNWVEPGGLSRIGNLNVPAEFLLDALIRAGVVRWPQEELGRETLRAALTALCDVDPRNDGVVGLSNHIKSGIHEGYFPVKTFDLTQGDRLSAFNESLPPRKRRTRE